MFGSSPDWSQASNRLFATLARHEKKGFTGYVDIRVGVDRHWRCAFSSGHLGWIDGGVHPWRSWHRQLTALNDAALQMQATRMENQQEIIALAQKSLWILPVKLLSAGQLTPKQFVLLLSGLCRESLFDIVWEIERSVRAGESRGTLKIADTGTEQPLGKVPFNWLIKPQQLCARVQQDWQNWKAAVPASIADCHVDRAPIIVEPNLLAKQIAPATFQRISILFDGKQTLRDIAQAVKQSEISLIRMLEPFLVKGWLQLKAVPDIVPSINQTGNQRPVQKTTQKKLIACIDDSPQVLALIKIVAHREGYDFIGIDDGLKSIPILIEKKPDLIFLDLVLPIVNGYELCEKLRQISSLRNTPIVMLSSNVLDRERAEKIGVRECLEKPISPRQLTQIMLDYTRQPHTEASQQETRTQHSAVAPC
ncbi:MAG: response regulator [Cyanobacteria bacterium J06641_5]